MPIQTSINSKLRFKVKSPYLASMVSMIVGTVFVILLSLILGQFPFFPLSISSNNWWLFLGGISGDIVFTVYILLLPHLGAVQTIIVPLLGQIIMSMLIDNFGLFNLPVNRFNLMRLIGIIILLIGVLTTVYQKNNTKKTNLKTKLPWQILGFIAGVASAVQTGSNGALGRFLNAPMKSACFSFISGSVILILIVGIFQRDFKPLKSSLKSKKYWWIWFGGLFGAVYALANLILAPLIGTGTTIVLNILGNMIGSLIIDKYGLIGTPKRKIGLKQYVGISVVVISVVLINMF